MKAAGVFAGVGGFERGFRAAGLDAVMMSEVVPEARKVLEHRFPDVDLRGDVREVRSLPGEVEIVCAGFPCTDISQAGRTAGMDGDESSLVGEVFRLASRRYPTWLVLENVSFLLQLGRGAAMRHLVDELEGMKMRWAYRVVDSRFTGVPQRRRRVILVASRTEDPREVLFADDVGDRPGRQYRSDAFGFYWTEGLRGLGWAQDAVPTLKGGSTCGIASPPAVWVPGSDVGRRIITPRVEDAEVLQGFPRGWTRAADWGRRGSRWTLVGNAVTVGVATWLGRRLLAPRDRLDDGKRVERWSGSWPTAAWGEKGMTHDMSHFSEFPRQWAYRNLLDVLRTERGKPLSHRAASGFLGRASKATLEIRDDFLADVESHVDFMAAVA